MLMRDSDDFCEDPYHGDWTVINKPGAIDLNLSIPIFRSDTIIGQVELYSIGSGDKITEHTVSEVSILSIGKNRTLGLACEDDGNEARRIKKGIANCIVQ